MKGTALWFSPSSKDEYGAVFFGYQGNWHPADGIVQGGMNEKGLCCDANALSSTKLNPNPEYKNAGIDFLNPILKTCANINETIEWFLTHNFGTSMQGQYHFMDANGDAVIVSVNKEGEWTFTKRGDSHYLVSTNFNVVNPDNGWYPCWRYDKANEMLANITKKKELTVNAFRDILEETAQSGNYPTQYSNIFNPLTLDFIVYHNHNFSDSVEFNLMEELNKLEGEVVVHKIPVLFGYPDWFFPPQPPTFVIIPTIIVITIVAVASYMIIKRKQNKNRTSK